MIAVGKLSGVAKREVPMEHREALARHVEAWIAKQGKKTERELAPLLGISQATLNEVRNCHGPLGLHVVLAIRKVVNVPLDALLGLDAAPRKPTELELATEGVLERLAEAAMDRVVAKRYPQHDPDALPPLTRKHR